MPPEIWEHLMTKKQEDVALWRFGIIAPLLHIQPGEACLRDRLHELAQRDWIHPDGQLVRLSSETLRKWLYRFRHGGLPGLENQNRCDLGQSIVSQALASLFFSLRNHHPRWTIQRILEEFMRKGMWNGRKPSRSALYRFAKSHNLNRDPHLQEDTQCRSFAFDGFGQLWSADFLHGPKLRLGRQKRKTYLHAIMDDATRYVVQSAFCLSETVETLISDLMVATGRYGVPQRFYTDNGACYSSRHLKIVCARLGMQLVHTPPYQPRGRGKIERFFRTVRDQFLTDEKFTSLDTLNTRYQEWLATYHVGLHGALKMTPLQARLKAHNLCRELPEVANIEPLFRMERRCRVYNDGTVRLFNRRYEVPGCMPSSRVTVYYLPWDLSQVHYGDDFLPAKPLDPLANAYRFDHPKGG
jgi:putative transposase